MVAWREIAEVIKGFGRVKGWPYVELRICLGLVQLLMDMIKAAKGIVRVTIVVGSLGSGITFGKMDLEKELFWVCGMEVRIRYKGGRT